MSTVIEYKCPACGGALEFNAALQKMKCPFCDSVFTVEELKNNDGNLKNAEATASDLHGDSFSWNSEEAGSRDGSGEEFCEFVCNSCGGAIIGDGNTAATDCPFCGNHVVITGRLKGMLMPDCVIPFKLDKNAAMEAYRNHIKGKFLLPKQFASENHIKEIKGIYVPFWIYDSEVDAYARFDAENVRYWSDSDYDYTETTTYDVFRAGSMSFSHIPVDGSTKMPDELMESIEPFDFSKAVPFKTAYLSGFYADKYDVDEKQSEDRANERLRRSTIEILRGTVSGYTSVRHYDRDTFLGKMSRMDEVADADDPFEGSENSSSGVKMLKGSVRYAFYPVYLLTTTYNGKAYTFAMNGQTGKFVGDLPVDKTKKYLTFAGIFAGTTALATLLFHLLGLGGALFG
ncbi:MAG: hypothetical protein IJT91_06740 [Clostridia bacterium]|nr:hypothetical protein [Clostridia bacterium]